MMVGWRACCRWVGLILGVSLLLGCVGESSEQLAARTAYSQIDLSPIADMCVVDPDEDADFYDRFIRSHYGDRSLVLAAYFDCTGAGGGFGTMMPPTVVVSAYVAWANRPAEARAEAIARANYRTRFLTSDNVKDFADDPSAFDGVEQVEFLGSDDNASYVVMSRRVSLPGLGEQRDQGNLATIFAHTSLRGKAVLIGSSAMITRKQDAAALFTLAKRVSAHLVERNPD